MVDGVLMVDDGSKLRVVVPEKIVPLILKFRHDLPLAGHREFNKTYEAISERYFWLFMHKEVKEYCSSCHLCQTKKHLSKQNRAPLKPIVVNTPWSLIGIDVSGPLKKTENGNKYVVVVVDYFTKFCVAKAVQDFTAETTARFVFEEVVCKLGAPKSMISDQGVNFKAKLFKRLCELCNIKTAHSSVYNEQDIETDFNNVRGYQA